MTNQVTLFQVQFNQDNWIAEFLSDINLLVHICALNSTLMLLNQSEGSNVSLTHWKDVS